MATHLTETLSTIIWEVGTLDQKVYFWWPREQRASKVKKQKAKNIKENHTAMGSPLSLQETPISLYKSHKKERKKERKWHLHAEIRKYKTKVNRSKLNN